MKADVFTSKARDALIASALLLMLSGCKTGHNGASTMGPEPKVERTADRSVATPLTKPTFLSLIGNKSAAELAALPTSVRVHLASQIIIDAPKAAASSAGEPKVSSPTVEPNAPELWNGKSRGGVAAESASPNAPGWIWEPPSTPLVPPVGANVAAPAPKAPVESVQQEKSPVEKAPVEPPVEDRAPIERVENKSLPMAQQPEARAQLATPEPSEELKRDEVLLIAFLVVLAVILATFVALLRYRAEHAVAHEWRRLR